MAAQAEPGTAARVQAQEQALRGHRECLPRPRAAASAGAALVLRARARWLQAPADLTGEKGLTSQPTLILACSEA